MISEDRTVSTFSEMVINHGVSLAILAVTGLGAWVVLNRHVIPGIKSLAGSHVTFLNTVQESVNHNSDAIQDLSVKHEALLSAINELSRMMEEGNRSLRAGQVIVEGQQTTLNRMLSVLETLAGLDPRSARLSTLPEPRPPASEERR